MLRYLIYATSLQIVSSYMHPSNFRSNIVNSILINSKIKNDFKKLNKDEALKLTSFWYNEINQSQFNEQSSTDHDYDPEHNNILKQILVDCGADDIRYLIWRPKIQICMTGSSYTDAPNPNHDALLYPSFRETICLIEVKSSERQNGILVSRIIKSPFWVEDTNNSEELLKTSLHHYFISFLKYPFISIN